MNSNISPSDAKPYDIKMHSHRFSAWAASRAATVKVARFKVEIGIKMLEACGFGPNLSDPDQLPTPKEIDQAHMGWCGCVIKKGWEKEISISHGVAAKLINVYLKSLFVCGGHHEHPNVAALHPPIDRVLLQELARMDFGGKATYWRGIVWSTLCPCAYQKLIETIREKLGDEPMWKIEDNWRGYQ